MKVKYSNNIYDFKGDLNCLYFSNLIEEGIEEVELSLFEEVFKGILYDTINFDEESDYITLYQGLSYFGSPKEKELIKHIKKKIYDKEKKILQKEITDYFEETKYGIQYELCENPSIPFEFLQKHFKNLENVSANLYANPSIPFEFIKEHMDCINWSSLCNNTSIPVQFFKENLDKLNIWCWNSLSRNPSIPLEFFEEHLNDVNWYCLCENPSIPLEFFKKHIDKIDPAYLCRNPSIPLESFKENLDKLDGECWSSLCHNPSIPIKFFEEHFDKINWYFLCKNPSIPLEFFKKHIDKLDGECWSSLCHNPSIPIEFFQENILCITSGLCLQKNPNITIDSLRKLKLNSDSMRNICANHFNLEKRIRDKIKNTIYFDFKPLNDLITK